jgi:hypothetical protein
MGEVVGNWAFDSDVVRAGSAVIYKGGTRMRPLKRGAITREVLNELLEWMTTSGAGGEE